MSGVAIVTGGSSGLGRAFALELARQRRSVVLVARDPARLAAVAAEAREAGGTATACAADVRDLPALTKALAGAVAGRPTDLVFHAAGVLALAAVDELGDDDFRSCFEVNVLGSAHVVQATLPLLSQSGGCLALVSSVAGLFALPGGFGAYAASKWALRGYAETIRPELERRGVSLTIAYPSILDTPMVRDLGPGAPDVYAAFPWHAPDRAARVFVRDVLRKRAESYVTASDRWAAVAARVAPRLFTRGLRAHVSRSARGKHA